MDKILFKKRMQNKIPARWHMSLICMLTIGSGIGVSKLLLLYNFSQPMWRYSLGVVFSYGIFFLLVYLWLRWYFGIRNQTVRSKNSVDSTTTPDVLDLTNITANINVPEPRWTGQGGQFSGGGASSSWGSDDAVSSAKTETTASKDVSIVDSDEIMVIVLIIAVIATISGSAFYIIYQAPEILFEAAFEVVLVTGLFGRTKNVQTEGWFYTIFKRTWLPFAAVLIAAFIFGFTIKGLCPNASSFAEYRILCGKR